MVDDFVSVNLGDVQEGSLHITANAIGGTYIGDGMKPQLPVAVERGTMIKINSSDKVVSLEVILREMLVDESIRPELKVAAKDMLDALVL
jgi:hypothetical protein